MREKSLTFGDFFFTLKALLLCAVPLFQSSSSDLAADYNVSLCGQNGNPAAYGALHGDEVSLRSLQLQRNHRMQAEAVCGHIHQMLSGCPKDPFRAKEVFTDKNNERSREFFSMQEARAERLRLELDAAKEKVGKFKNSMLNSFPSATSNKFGEALDEFKEYFNRKK